MAGVASFFKLSQELEELGYWWLEFANPKRQTNFQIFTQMYEGISRIQQTQIEDDFLPQTAQDSMVLFKTDFEVIKVSRISIKASRTSRLLL